MDFGDCEMTDIDTKYITLIGTPLRQSFAARMQNAGYRAAGLNMHYFYTEADSEHLEEIINGIRYMPSFAGCAVTKPNKVKVLPYLDELDPLCEKMGACNTVKKTADGRLIGYNTDGIGFIRSLKEEGGMEAKGKTFFCIGAGGAGHAMCSTLAYNGAKKIWISDRMEDSARELVEDINRKYSIEAVLGEGAEQDGELATKFAPIAEFVPYGCFDPLTECDVFLNATGIGMGKSVGRSILPRDTFEALLQKRSEQGMEKPLCFDACYNPDRTQFLMDAESLGCPVLNGLGMSLYQGIAQIRIWTDQIVPIEGIDSAMDKEMKDRMAGAMAKAMREELLKIIQKEKI